MALGSVRISRRDPRAWRYAATGLVVAAALVGAAILVGGSMARALNGLGALAWLASGLALALTLPLAPRAGWGWAAALAGGLLLGAVVRPGTLPAVLLAFGITGAAAVLAAGDRTGGWALLVPAAYLPVHLAIGIGRALLTDGGVRTAPPPTAAAAPLAMVLAALAAGVAAATLLRRDR